MQERLTLFTMKQLINKLKLLVISAVFIVPITIPLLTAHASTSNNPKVSFTFDDAYLSAFTQAAPTLSKYGITGTEYAPTNCIGSKGTCPADTASTYMSWDQVTALKNTYNWEIGAHTVNHTPISRLSNANLVKDITTANQAFATHGISPTAFASPKGDYSASALATIAKYYASHRGFHDTGYNTYPYNDYILRVQQVQVGVSVAQVKSYIDTAKASGQWLILVFHEIQPTPNPNPLEYEYATSDLDQIASYVKTQGVATTNVTDGIIANQTNIVPNSTFSNGLSQGWTTDDPTKITLDSANNGSSPNSTQSIRMVANTTKDNHLFGPKVAVDSTDTYVAKQYIKLNAIKSGDVSFYIDEYDIFGNWISGQYKASINWLFPEQKAFVYHPTTTNVRYMSLQIIVPKASGITAFIDNVQLFSGSGSVVTPPTAPVDLLANGTFDAGLSQGWTTNTPLNVIADSANHGDPLNPVNSIKFTSTTNNVHLFSPKVSVTNTKNYSLSAYRNIATLSTGEFGYYIDEYDINDNWISGQYKGSVYATGANTNTIGYTPSSANVATASLQIFVTGNIGITAYVDNVKWYQL